MGTNAGRDPPRVGLLFDTDDAYYRPLLAGVLGYARDHGRWRIGFAGLGPRRADFAPVGAAGRPALPRWRGVLIDGAAEPQLARRLAALGVAAVDVSPSPARHAPLPRVVPDDAAVGRLAAEHLLARGFRQFGCYALPTAFDMLWCERRVEGFRGVVGAGRCAVHRPAAAAWDLLWGRPQRARLGRWLCDLPKPVGVLACMDTAGRHIIDFCRDQGIAVPEQVSIVAVNNDLAACEGGDPPMSSVELGPERIGYAAAAALDRLMAGDGQGGGSVPAETLVSPTGLIARRSSDALAVPDANVAAAMRLIADRATLGSLDVAAVADAVAVSRRWLEKQFRRHVGRSIAAHIAGVRIDRAKQLLTDTDLPMPAVARRCGFPSAFQLSVSFKRLAGEPPTAYRARRELGGVAPTS